MSAALAPVIPIRGTLYEIAAHLDALYDTEALAATAEEQAAIQVDIARWIEAEIRKVDSVAGYMRYCVQQQRNADQEIARLQNRKAAFASREERTKECVIVAMELLKLKRLEGRTNTTTLQPCPISVNITDESAVPIDYKSITVTMPATTWEWVQTGLPEEIRPSKTAISKSRIAAAIQKQKIDVPGATLVTDKKTAVCR
jgi:Siphovirus Gp157